MAETAELVARAKAALEEAERAHEAVNRASFEISAALQSGGELSEGELTDVGYLLRLTEDMLNDARKEAMRRKDQLSRALALIITRRAVSEGSRAIAYGELAIAVPDVKMRTSVPKRDTPEYVALLKHFGVSAEIISTGALTLHWEHLSDWLTAACERGEQTPPGITTLRPDATVSYRKNTRSRKDNEDDGT